MTTTSLTAKPQERVSAALTAGPVLGPPCRRALTRGCAHPSCAEMHGAVLGRISTAALTRESRRRRLASATRDVNANPRNVNGDYFEDDNIRRMAGRAITAYARRVGAGNIEQIADLAALHDEVEAAIGLAARELAARYSWAEIGQRLGIERTSAWDKYHDPDGNRRRRGTQLAGGNRTGC